jgi:hypothetical protein
MLHTKTTEVVTEALVVLSSARFLAWYVWVKLAMWPWGACRLSPWCP